MEYTFARDYLYFNLSDVVNGEKKLTIPINAYSNIQKPGHTMLFRCVNLVFDDGSVNNVSVFTKSLMTDNCYGDGGNIYLSSNNSKSSPLIKISRVPTELILSFTKDVGSGEIVFEIIYVPERIQYAESYPKSLV